MQAENIELTPEGQNAVDDQINDRERARTRVELAITSIEPFQKLYESDSKLSI